MVKKVAVCFFGITRSLSHTIGSIEANVLSPARRLSDPIVLSHFFDQIWIDNPRSGEKGLNQPEAYKLLNNDWINLEEPNACLDIWDFDGLQYFGDYLDDDFISLRNLVHQLHSLNSVTTEALAQGANICLFCRPDLRYHDSLLKPLKRALKDDRNVVYLPSWQAWDGGLNDRFAICVGRDAIAAYGQRIHDAYTFCKAGGRPLHAEQLLKDTLLRKNISVEKISTRASRVRIDGTQAKLDAFRHPIWKFASKTADQLGIKPALRKILKQRR